jgi:glycosyltransferase 2 family protein
MKLRVTVIAALGVALALYLVVFVGFTAVFSSAVAIGWGGFAVLCLYAAALLRGAGAATAAVAASLDAIYRSRVRVGLSAALHLASWIASAIGTWIAFRLIGAHIDLAAVIAIESLISAARSAAVFVPNALGVQEAAYAVLAPLFGVGAEFGLAVSLIKRARDIAVGVPILLIWQGVEGQRALAARRG